VHGEDLFIDDGCNRQAVEAISERLPELDVVSPLALVIETVDAVDRRTLVVAAEDEEVFRVLDLVCQQQADGLQRLLSAINVVSEEQIVCFGREAAVLEQAEQIIVLSVDVTADLSMGSALALKRKMQKVIEHDV
jgi:hypothetical protein